MNIFSCSHSLLGSCLLCRLWRGEIAESKVFFTVAFVIGVLLGFFGVLKW